MTTVKSYELTTVKSYELKVKNC